MIISDEIKRELEADGLLDESECTGINSDVYSGVGIWKNIWNNLSHEFNFMEELKNTVTPPSVWVTEPELLEALADGSVVWIVKNSEGTRIRKIEEILEFKTSGIFWNWKL